MVLAGEGWRQTGDTGRDKDGDIQSPQGDGEMNKSLMTVGSIGQVAESGDKSIAAAMVSCEVVVVLDVSGSMTERDAGENGWEMRQDVAERQLAEIQATHPGQVALVCFSHEVEFLPGGIPRWQHMSTDMAAALRFARMADGVCRVVVVSDGEPDSQEAALNEAREYKHPIDVIFIGPKGGHGERFLLDLARETGGKRFTADRPGELAAGVIALLEARSE
jgi:hypothetical protein